MSKTVRSWQKRAGWKDNRHQDAKKSNFGKRKDRFHFDPNKEYKNEHV